MADNRKDLKSPFYTTREAAEFCRRSPNTMKQYRTSGGGPVYFRTRGRVLYTMEALIEWLTAFPETSTACMHRTDEAWPEWLRAVDSMFALASHGGLVDVPCWALRPGGVHILGGAENAMPVWCLLHSMNGVGFRPSEASEGTLADTLAMSRSTLRHRLEALRRTDNGALLLELRRPRRSAVRTPPIYRWAVNPFEIKRFVKVVCRSHLPRIAEERGLSGDWLWEANNQVGKHFAKARIFAEMLGDELLSEPCVSAVHNGKAADSRLRGRPRSRRQRRSRYGRRWDSNAPSDVNKYKAADDVGGFFPHEK